MRKNLRIIISLILVVISIIIFGLYVGSHTSLLKQVGHTPWTIFLKVLTLYILWFISLAKILDISAKIGSKKLKTQENLLLSSYSTIVNFFVPGQGGPAIRGGYLFKKHSLKIRVFVLITLFYYFFYLVISLSAILITEHLWLYTLGFLMLAWASSAIIFKLYIKYFKLNKQDLELKWKLLVYLFIATLAQLVIGAIIYFVELNSINHSITIHQTIIYSGIANLSLFVALTPGALGIKESFLILSEKLHHISTTNIISANIIDRSVFLVFIGLLAVLVISTHTRNKLFTNRTSPDLSKDSET